MDRIFRIFISSSKQTLEYEREALINNILRQNCVPITMEYFINSNNITTLGVCINKIDNSDAVILILKTRYGSKIGRSEIERTFPNGCPLEETMCKECTGDCNLSYTHFEYLYSKLKHKVLYVIGKINKSSGKIRTFFEDAQKNGCYNLYTDLNSFNSTSAAIISKIVQECATDNSLGLVPASFVKDLPNLQQRINFLENNFYNGFIPQKNLMGCLMVQDADDLIFYVYKELKLKEHKSGFDFSIHINIGDKSDVDLSKNFVAAHSYVKYGTADDFTHFYECQINEKSYGREYLNCHIDFIKQDDSLSVKTRLPIKKGDIVGILYTYKVNKRLYGNEIGRKISPFFEKTLVELVYAKDRKELSFDCFEKVENSFIDVEGLDSKKIKPNDKSFLQDILSTEELNSYLISTYNCGDLSNYLIKEIQVPEFFDEYGNRRLSHFYVKWSEQ